MPIGDEVLTIYSVNGLDERMREYDCTLLLNYV